MQTFTSQISITFCRTCKEIEFKMFISILYYHKFHCNFFFFFFYRELDEFLDIFRQALLTQIVVSSISLIVLWFTFTMVTSVEKIK